MYIYMRVYIYIYICILYIHNCPTCPHVSYRNVHVKAPWIQLYPQQKHNVLKLGIDQVKKKENWRR